MSHRGVFSSAGVFDPITGQRLGEAAGVSAPSPTLRISRVRNGYMLSCNDNVWVASDVDSLYNVLKQALVECKIGAIEP